MSEIPDAAELRIAAENAFRHSIPERKLPPNFVRHQIPLANGRPNEVHHRIPLREATPKVRRTRYRAGSTVRRQKRARRTAIPDAIWTSKSVRGVTSATK